MKALLLVGALLISGLAHAQVRYSCTETSNFHNTYQGTGDSQLEAKANAIQSCQESEQGLFCQNEVQCDSSVVNRWGGNDVVTCMETSNFHNVYQGSGLNQAEARANAVQSCQASEQSLFCQNEVECDSSFVSHRGYNQPVTCVETSNFHNAYLGKGLNKVEAKANAIQACQAKEQGLFCQNEVECQ